jgi:DtxR family transcriptional regulator, Mn-dependent transcriptional regulator
MALHSYTEENYLKCIYTLCSNNTEVSECSTTAIAQHLNVQKASVSAMLRKLSAKGLINFETYGKAKLNNTGAKVALQVIRKHRLWEVFLVQKLQFKWDEVHHVAEQLEHIQSVQLIDELDKFLDYPTVDPHGEPIPSSDGTIQKITTIKLSDLETGVDSVICSVPDNDGDLLNYLAEHGIVPGSTIKMYRKSDTLETVFVLINDKTIALSKKITDSIIMMI